MAVTDGRRKEEGGDGGVGERYVYRTHALTMNKFLFLAGGIRKCEAKGMMCGRASHDLKYHNSYCLKHAALDFSSVSEYNRILDVEGNMCCPILVS